MTTQRSSITDAKPHAVGFNLAVIAMLTCLLGIGGAYIVDDLRRTDAMPQTLVSNAPVTRTIGGRSISIPPALFRNGIVDGLEFTSQIDLALQFPTDTGDAHIDVTLLPASKVKPSSALLDGVYIHKFENDSIGGIPGLVGKPLQPTTGYSSEAVWYDPLSARPFVAKCIAALDPAKPARCLRSVVLSGGLGAVYAFDADLLTHWRDFDAIVTPQLAAIGAS